MRMREALFFSSKDATFYNRTSNDLAYYIRVEEDTEEYTPTFLFGSPPGPHFRSVYQVLVSRVKDEKIQQPHMQYKCYDIDQCEDFLHVWGIETEHGWTPDEDNSPKIELKGSDIPVDAI